MTPELEPNPVTDEAAYRALRDQSYAIQSQLRRIESERADIRAAEAAERTRLAEEKHAAEMVEKYPNSVPDQVYSVASQAAYRHDGEDAEEPDIEEFYEMIVEVINEATKPLSEALETIHALHGRSIDPNECQECDMGWDGHQLAPAGFPCRTKAVTATALAAQI